MSVSVCTNRSLNTDGSSPGLFGINEDWALISSKVMSIPIPPEDRLSPCPLCNSDQVGIQRPMSEDGMARRVYVKCFGCGHDFPDMTREVEWVPVPWTPSIPTDQWRLCQERWEEYVHESVKR